MVGLLGHAWVERLVALNVPEVGCQPYLGNSFILALRIGQSGVRRLRRRHLQLRAFASMRCAACNLLKAT